MRFGKTKGKDEARGGENVAEDRVREAMEAQYRRKNKPFYFRKNALVTLAALQSLFLLPNRAKRGPIYPSYNKRTELWYRAVMKVADHHYLLSWEDLRNLYPIPPTPKASYVRKVTLPCGLRGEFVCWMPKNEAREIRKREKDYQQLKARREKEGGDLPEESPYFRDKPTIMFIHGGGFCIGTVPSYKSWCWKLSRLLGGIQFFLVDYTLSPEVTFPVALQQCWKAYLWLLDPKGGGIPADRLIIAGDSAGGNLSLSLLYVIRQVRLEKERTELQLHRQRRLGLSSSSATVTATMLSEPSPSSNVDTNHPAQHPREWKKGPVEKWIEKEREREEVAPSEAVQKVLQCQQKAKERLAATGNAEDAIAGEGTGDLACGEEDIAAADASSEARWPACDMTESQHRAWARRTLASDEKFMLKHQLPFELDDHERDVFPPMPLAAILLSPWVDLSEHSSVFVYRSYPRPEKFRPYHIGLRFVQGYLNLQPSDYPFTKRKEKELRRAFMGGLKAQSREKRATREKDRVRNKWEKKRWERRYLVKIMYEELRLRQVDRDERRHSRRRQESLLSLRDEEREAEVERSHASDVGTSEGAADRTDEDRIRQQEQRVGGAPPTDPQQRMAWEMERRRSQIIMRLQDEREKERNRTSIYSPYISPIYGDLLGLPPLLITGGDVEPLWEDIRKIHQKAEEQGTEVELYVGHYMNHDFQFFFNVLPHPEVGRFFTHVKEWLRNQMDLRRDREASLKQQHSLLPTTGADSRTSVDAAAEAVPPVKAAEPAADERTWGPIAEEPVRNKKDKDKERIGERRREEDGLLRRERIGGTGEGEVKVTVIESGSPPPTDLGFVALGLHHPNERFDHEDAEVLHAVRTPPYLV